MLPRRTITKRQKKERSRKRLGAIFVVLGLFIIALFLSYAAFFDKGPIFVSPLSKNQETSITRVEELLKENGIQYESIESGEDRTYLVKLDKKSEVILDSKQKVDEQISSLQLILRQLKIEGRTFKRLDFRYQKPVISF
jgi:cell division septal protein FtsQ